RAHDRLCDEVEIPQDVRYNALIVVCSPDMTYDTLNPVRKEPPQNRSSITVSGLQAILVQVRYQLAVQSFERVERGREPCSEQTLCEEQILECPLISVDLCRLL